MLLKEDRSDIHVITKFYNSCNYMNFTLLVSWPQFQRVEYAEEHNVKTVFFLSMSDILFLKTLEDYTDTICFKQLLGLETLLNGYGYLHMTAYSNSMPEYQWSLSDFYSFSL